ncbi:hypothetical protein GUI12_00120 [Anaplasmataceae bacterium AB001_6]|nr:hypothetical protein GUI12_00120 [Anaplasmataceae bacterium AB001_6]
MKNILYAILSYIGSKIMDFVDLMYENQKEDKTLRDVAAQTDIEKDNVEIKNFDGKKVSFLSKNGNYTNWVFVPDLEKTLLSHAFIALRQSTDVSYIIKKSLRLSVEKKSHIDNAVTIEKESVHDTKSKKVSVSTQTEKQDLNVFQKSCFKLNDSNKDKLLMFYSGPLKNWVHVPDLKVNSEKYGCIILQDPNVFDYDIDTGIKHKLIPAVIPAINKQHSHSQKKVMFDLTPQVLSSRGNKTLQVITEDKPAELSSSDDEKFQKPSQVMPKGNSEVDTTLQNTNIQKIAAETEDWVLISQPSL